MYLLKQISESKIKTTIVTFTFHYVSIKTYLNYSLYNHHYYLHSTMYLLKLVCRAGQTNTWKDLHSTMYLLKRGQHRRHIQSHMYLHSTMYLLKQDNISDCYLVSSFTFHYVSIKTKRRCNRCTNRLWFTFHYVSIKTCLRQISNKNLLDLHSTMYLLKHYDIYI